MKKSFAITMLALGLMLTSVAAHAQGFGGPEAMKGKIVYGGNFNLGASGYSLYLGVAPQVGYRLTRSLEAGVRLGYDLHFYHDYYGRYFCHYFSGAVYANYEIWNGIYAQVEDEEMCQLVTGTSRWYNSVFVGGGYRQYFSATGFVFYSVLYNLSWDYGINGYSNSPYASPFVVRVGYCGSF